VTREYGSKESEDEINVVFNIMEQWLSVNKLKMNAEKTKCMMKSLRKEQKTSWDILMGHKLKG